MSDLTPDEKVCPFCAETIKKAAVRCRYCRSDLPAESASAEEPVAEEPAIEQPAIEEPAPEEPAADGPAPAAERSAPLVARRDGIPTAALAAIVAALLVLTGVLAFTLARKPAVPEDAAVTLTSQSARDAALQAAVKLTQQALSYTWNTRDRDIRTAQAGMTPSFAEEYLATMEKVKKETLENQLTLKATAATAGIVSADEHKVRVLLFVNQSTTSRGSKNARVDQSRVTVTLTRGNGDWRISKIDAF